MSSNPTNTRTMKVVYAITERAPGKSYWTRIGVGFVNQDGSINLRLECLPFGPNTSMQIRDYDARDAEREAEQSSASGRTRTRREPLEAGALA